MNTVSGAMSAGLAAAFCTGAVLVFAETAFVRTGTTFEANGEEDALTGAVTAALGTAVEVEGVAAGSLLLLLNVTSKRLPSAETW